MQCPCLHTVSLCYAFVVPSLQNGFLRCFNCLAGFDFIVLIDMDTSVWRDGVLLVY